MLETRVDPVEDIFKRLCPTDVDFCSLRLLRTRTEALSVRQNVLQPVRHTIDAGAMFTVIDGDGLGYGATSELTESGLRAALEAARHWARYTRGRGVVDFHKLPMLHNNGEYASPIGQPWNAAPLSDKIDLLRRECERLKTDSRISDWETSLEHQDVEQTLITNGGARVHQHLSIVLPTMYVAANEGSDTQFRTLEGRGMCRQGGFDLLAQIGFFEAAPRLADEALQLLAAPNCPSERMHLLLAPDQMALQIHESIGHPLELDRILGDERNYAGTSFVTMDMFGSYRYGSDLLNVTFDPTHPQQLASYGFDDDGQAATKQYVIRNGVLERPLGGHTSQLRASMAGTANARACSWNRPPIDRMANLNLEPGTSTFDEMVAAVEHGIYMKTNLSWSIDDSRNKFQFGCEWAQLIENGKLTKVVKSPNYRGISANFWRNLVHVGNRETFALNGTPNCGKGEPNQMVAVGHASPAALFADVDVFGGE
jgi:predicted Zn-dependent protease